MKRIFIVILFLLGWGVGFATYKVESYGRIGSMLSSYESIRVTNGITNGLEESALVVQNMRLVTDHFVGYMKLNTHYYSSNDGLMMNLDKAYVSFQNPSFSFSLGLDRLVYGVAYGWNPADVLNPAKSLLYRDSEKRREDQGILCTSLANFGVFKNLSYELRAVVVPDKGKKLEETKGVFSGKIVWSGLELMFLGMYQKAEVPIYAGYLRTPFFGLDWLTLYSEFHTYNFETNHQVLVGLQANPVIPFLNEMNTMFVVEYFKNFSGYTNEMKHYYADFPGKMPVLTEIFSDYIYSGLSFFSLTTAMSCGVFWNLNDIDQSGLFNFMFQYNVTDYSKVELGGYLTFGNKEAEFPSLVNQKYELYIDFSVYYDFSS